jgi:CTP synthase
VVRRLNLPFRDVDWTEWDDLLRRVHEPQACGSRSSASTRPPDAYLSVAEALRAGGTTHQAKVEIRWVASDDCETEAGAAAVLNDVHGVLTLVRHPWHQGRSAPSSSPASGVAVLGLCLACSAHVIEAAIGAHRRSQLAEFDPKTPDR